MHILEKAGGPSTNTKEITAGFKVAIVDGMAEVQSHDKPEWIKNCRDLAEHFTNRLLVKYNDLQELHIIFDRYDLLSSLKSATQVKRQGGHAPIYYRITDSTHIDKVPMKKLLPHSKTKGELTTFLAKNVKDNANERQVVVAWGTECEATHRDVRHLRSTQVTSVVGNSQMTAQEVEWNSWFVGCTNQRQTSKLSKPSDGPSLRKIKLSLRGCRPHKLLSIKPY